MRKYQIYKEFGSKNVFDSVSCLFNEAAKINKISFKKFEARIVSFAMSRNKEKSMQPFKFYPGAYSLNIDGYKVLNQKNQGLIECIEKRRSVRTYKRSKISLHEIGYLLHYSYGITENYKVNIEGKQKEIGLRSVPSAGALYPLEFYAAIYGGECKDGIYHYQPYNDTIEYVCDIIPKEELSKIINSAPIVDIQNASMVIFATSIVERYLIKYGDRGYKFMLQETGFAMENLSLLSTSIGYGSCMLGGFFDDEINRLLGLDGVFETVNCVIVIGKE